MAFEVSVSVDEVFGSEGGVELLWDVYRPQGVVGPLPVVLLFHGGGWRRGERGTMREAASGFAERGFLALAVGYRLLSDEVAWPGLVYDVKTAVRAVRARSGELGADGDRVALVGYSAGAHVALLAAASAGSSTVFAGGDREYGEESEAVGAVAAFFAPVTKDGSVMKVLGLSGEAAVESAPLEYASLGVLPPVLLLHGTKDGLVPHEPNSVAMFEALRAAGTPTDLRLYDGMAHEFVRLPGMMDATVHDVASFFDRHMVRSEEFAVALGEAAAVWAERVAARAASGG